MSIKTLEKYDFESITDYYVELNKHIAKKTDNDIRLVTIALDYKSKNVCTMSSMSKKLLYKVLTLILLDAKIDDKEMDLASAMSQAQLKKIIDALMGSNNNIT